MAKITPEERPLPLNLPTPVAKPTGEVMDTRKPYTLPLNNEIALTRCVGPYRGHCTICSKLHAKSPT
jgi:hypothetical protein